MIDALSFVLYMTRLLLVWSGVHPGRRPGTSRPGSLPGSHGPRQRQGWQAWQGQDQRAEAAAQPGRRGPRAWRGEEGRQQGQEGGRGGATGGGGSPAQRRPQDGAPRHPIDGGFLRDAGGRRGCCRQRETPPRPWQRCALVPAGWRNPLCGSSSPFPPPPPWDSLCRNFDPGGTMFLYGTHMFLYCAHMHTATIIVVGRTSALDPLAAVAGRRAPRATLMMIAYFTAHVS